MLSRNFWRLYISSFDFVSYSRVGPSPITASFVLSLLERRGFLPYAEWNALFLYLYVLFKRGNPFFFLGLLNFMSLFILFFSQKCLKGENKSKGLWCRGTRNWCDRSVSQMGGVSLNVDQCPNSNCFSFCRWHCGRNCHLFCFFYNLKFRESWVFTQLKEREKQNKLWWYR